MNHSRTARGALPVGEEDKALTYGLTGAIHAELSGVSVTKFFISSKVSTSKIYGLARVFVTLHRIGASSSSMMPCARYKNPFATSLATTHDVRTMPTHPPRTPFPTPYSLHTDLAPKPHDALRLTLADLSFELVMKYVPSGLS